MYNFFIWLCFLCFCIVLAAIVIFTFDVTMLRESPGPIYGCGVVGDPLFYVQCDDEPWRWARETVLNLPFFLQQAPLITLWGPGSLEQKWLPFIYLSDIVLFLALIHVLRVIVFVWPRRRHADEEEG
ncbi:MAG TPA: hypothetical protein VKD43_01290 [Xanthobacteraceae bacterium]|nr:hypothetical protein [Xanthobacteraceae bacterium]